MVACFITLAPETTFTLALCYYLRAYLEMIVGSVLKVDRAEYADPALVGFDYNRRILLVLLADSELVRDETKRLRR